MFSVFKYVIRPIACALLVLSSQADAQVLTRAIPAKGPATRTLLLSSGRYTPYSLTDALGALKLQLRRVMTDIEEVSASAVDTNQLAGADYVVVFCPQPDPTFSEPALHVLAERHGPVLWVGYGAELLQQLPPFENRFTIAGFAAEEPAEVVSYKSRRWDETLNFWIPALISGEQRTNIIMAVPPTQAASAPKPFAWRNGDITFFTALPTQTGGCALFSDLLLDFYGVADSNLSSAVGVIIEGYHCRQDHLEFRNLVKTLSERGHPFIVGVIPTFYDPVQDKVFEMDTQPEFVAALRFAQQHGGRLILQGCLDAYKGRTGSGPEFWDGISDRPLPVGGSEHVRERVELGLNQMFARGLLPLGWRTPNYSASRAVYAELAEHFSTSVERVQLSDATAKENFAGSCYSMDDHGRFIIPENLGAMSPLRNPSPVLRMHERAATLTGLRGTVALCSFPAYLTDDKLAQVVTMLEHPSVPFLDLAEGDNWVQTADYLLLTGKASRTVSLNNARVRWQAFDRRGKRLAQEEELAPVAGERTFTRRGKGDYEVYQFIQEKP